MIQRLTPAAACAGIAMRNATSPPEVEPTTGLRLLSEPGLGAEAEPAPIHANPVSFSSPGRIRRVVRWLDRVWNGLFGVVSLVVLLAIVATIPVVQLLSLGYLLEASGRVARSGSLRAGLVGRAAAARLGSLLLGGWLLLWIPRFCSNLWQAAWLIDPNSSATRFWRGALVVAAAWVVLHASAAIARGGRLRHFLWPRPLRFLRRLKLRGAYRQLRDQVWGFTTGLRLPAFFWLGLRGFLGSLVWLLLPITLLAVAKQAPVLGVIGGALLMYVLLYLPILQTELARTGRWSALFELRAARRIFARAPLAYGLSLLLLLALALPLYLLKIELIPREAEWLPSVLFVASIWPARLAVGWAVGRGERRELPRHWVFRWLSRLSLVPVTGAYVLLVYFTQYLSWYGVWSLYEQHAFLLPVPFLGG